MGPYFQAHISVDVCFDWILAYMYVKPNYFQGSLIQKGTNITHIISVVYINVVPVKSRLIDVTGHFFQAIEMRLSIRVVFDSLMLRPSIPIIQIALWQ